MSSRLTIILLSLILLPGCGNDRRIDDRTAMGINGDVRQMTVVREDLANGLPPMLDDWQSEVWFDSAGRLSAVNGFEFSAHGDSITVTPSDSRTGIVIKLRRWQDGTALHYDGTVTDLSFPGRETSQCSASITLDDMGRVAAVQDTGLLGGLLRLADYCTSSTRTFTYESEGPFPSGEHIKASLGDNLTEVTITFTYSATDSLGNWTMRTATDATTGKPAYIERRRLDYQ